MSNFFWEYFLFAFIASCGVLQIAASHAQLKGLLFFKRKSMAYAFATLTIGGAFGWFFGWDNRLDDKILVSVSEERYIGLMGSEQFYCFVFAAFSALVFTLIASSIVNRRASDKPIQSEEEGLEILKERSYFEAIKYSLRKILRKRINESDSCFR